MAAAGTMRRRLTFQNPDVTPDSYGDTSERTSWTDYVTVWGSLVDLSGTELYQAQAVRPYISARAVIRWRSDIVGHPERRVVDAYTGRSFDVKGIADPDGRHAFLELTLMERVGEFGNSEL